MKQILHIFAKDTRRFWPEILISLAVTIAFVCIGPNLWLARRDFNLHAQMMRTLAGLLLALVPVSWWILITRVIQEERLVGDTQFWITRPYEWKKLLVAKAIYITAFVYLPFFIAQTLLLAEAGFHPLASMTGLLFNLLMATGIIVLPLMALAAITPSFARMTLTMLGILIASIALFVPLALIFTVPYGTIANHIGNRLCFALVLSACGATIVMQYAVRKITLARTVLLAIPLMIFAVLLIGPDQHLVNHTYPVVPVQASTVQASAPIQLTYFPEGAPLRWSSTQIRAWNLMIGVQIPLKETGVTEGYVVVSDGFQAEVTASDGTHWRSAWLSDKGDRVLPGEHHTDTTFMMPVEVYKKFQSMPLTVHLRFAITEAKAGNSASILLPDGDFFVPDFGVCSPNRFGINTQWEGFFGIACISPLRPPQLTHIATHWSQGQCSATPSTADQGMMGDTWVGALDREQAESGISPVELLNVNLSHGGYRTEGNPNHLCPGTPITFTSYNAVLRTQTSIDIQNYHLRKMTDVGGKIFIETLP